MTKEELIENVETLIQANRNNKYCSVTQLMVMIMEAMEGESND
jgi:hypothetical protein